MASTAKRTKDHLYDLVVVGAGVNGMVGALLAAQRGLKVLLLEGYHALGGGVRTEELTLPGFRHDICSAIHPFGRSSPVLRSLDLESEGLRWIEPEIPLAHPLLDQEAVLLYRSIHETALELGRGGELYRLLMTHLVKQWPRLESALLGPPIRLPHPSLWPSLASFGLPALTSATALGRLLGPRGSALWGGLACHSLLPLEQLGSSAVACVLGLMAHWVGWPMPQGGASAIGLALEQKLRRAGVEIATGRKVSRVSELPPHRALLLDLSARQILTLFGPLLKPRVRRGLGSYRLGPGIFKVDYALSAPVPWADPRVSSAATVHIGGSLAEMAASERAVWSGRISSKPFLLGVQPTLFDPTRAPEGKHVFWVYLHTPNGWFGNELEVLEQQMERFAPGFRDLVIKRAVRNSPQYEKYNPNYVGGDILGGANTLPQVVFRPRVTLDPYHLGDNVFCCSASVPPGGGIHGMGGYHAFESLWRRIFRS